MDFIPPHKYLQWNPNTMEEVRQEVNLHRPGEMKEAVRILQEWIQQQPHFKKKDLCKIHNLVSSRDLVHLETRLGITITQVSTDLSPHLLEIAIIMTKGSIERTKKMIDGIYTTRTLMPNFYEAYNPKIDFKPLWEKGYWAIIPKLTPDNCRIFLFKIVGKYDSTQSSDIVSKHAFFIIEYLAMHDYAKSVIMIYDLTETDLIQTMKNYNLFELRTLFLTILESYKLRLKQFHVLTTSRIIESFINFFKPFIKNKIMERVIVNKPDELINYYPKNILPKDYGGDEKSIPELHEQCIDMLSTDEYLEHAKSMLEARVDESLRPQGQFGEMYAGTVGTFRSLNVD